jgi:hypothetical protein
VRISLLPHNCHVPCHLIRFDVINGVMAEYNPHSSNNVDCNDDNATGGGGGDDGGNGGSCDELAARVAVEVMVMVVIVMVVVVVVVKWKWCWWWWL